MENASELKAMITSVFTTVNPKGSKEITSDNFSRYIFTTNKANPVDMTQNERRFVLLACSKDKQGNHEFWTKIRKYLFTPEAGSAVAHYLMNKDIYGFNPRQLPVNEFQQSIIESEQTSEEKFINDTEDGWDGKETKSSILYAQYKSYCEAHSLPSAGNANWFGVKLQPMVRDKLIINSIRDGCSYYSKP